MDIKTNVPLMKSRGRITEKISKFWDGISRGILLAWGPHIHHGYYDNDENQPPLEAVKKLLSKTPSLDKETITHLITASCTGFSAPGFDLYIAKQLGLSPGINRFHIGFMGCFAAFPALNLARSICLAEPWARVLVVNTELCSLHFQQNRELDIIIANAIFADGVSAALVSSEPGDSRGNKIILHKFFSRDLAGSEDKMAWSLGDTAFGMKLSAYILRILDENIAPVISDFLRDTEVAMEEIKLWAIHPGGRAILDKLGKSLGLEYEDISEAYGILRDYGNMSSATIMFLLERMMDNDKYGKMFSAAFGPGLTVETGYMEKIHRE